MNSGFNYDTAFSRNIGWVTETEQALLRSRRIAIAGLGGVGGSHLLTLTRLGIGGFNISDLDTFELANFNRQAGSSMSHVGRQKVEVMAELAADINPELDLKRFPKGVNRDNLSNFLEGVDLYVDGLDFFAVDARRAVFSACADKGIPAITAAPLGMGAALLCFLPGKMTFEQYFQLEGQSEDEQLLRFLLGLSPAMLQMPYLVDDSRVDLAGHKGPSTAMACELCAGLTASHALKILLHRGKVPAAPTGLHFDSYRNKISKTWRPGGNSNPLQRIGLKIARSRLSEKLNSSSAVQTEQTPETAIERILDLARWAPSGDNTQPWRFEIVDDRNFIIHAQDTRDWCVYDLEGRASQIAVGALLETIAVAASGEGLSASFERQQDSAATSPLIRVSLSAGNTSINPLLPYIKARVTQRRSLSTKPLSKEQKRELEASVGEGYRVVWIDGAHNKWRMAKLLYRNAGIRLTIPEAYEVHKRIIEWNAQFSLDRIPDRAVGLDPVALKLMRWAMQSWERVAMLNRYFAGTLMPRIQLDLLPGLRCSAHFCIVADRSLETIEDFFNGGRALQRFWLTSAKLGLQFQPEMTPIIFSYYTRAGVKFTDDTEAVKSAETLRNDLDALIGERNNESAVFMGRLGIGTTPASRSLRLNLSQLTSRCDA